ncbi:MAG: hypothetical protein R2754_01800 [Microthrixaceae bacterium]
MATTVLPVPAPPVIRRAAVAVPIRQVPLGRVQVDPPHRQRLGQHLLQYRPAHPPWKRAFDAGVSSAATTSVVSTSP